VGGNPEPFVYEDYAVDWEEGDEVTEDLGEYAVSATKPDHFLPYLFEQYYEEDYGPSSSPSVEYEPWTYVAEGKIGPFLTTQWHQQSPFNDEYPTMIPQFKKAPAGCVPVAIAQIIAANEKPATSYFGVTSTWDELKSYNTEDYNESFTVAQREKINSDLAKILYKIGGGVKADINFCFSGQTFATPAAAKRYMKRKLGYGSAKKHKGYKGNKIEDMLNAGKPVFIAAISGLANGHAWVIDGSMYQERIGNKFEIGYPVSHFTETRKLLHCNFGYPGGKCNGYYIPGVFDLNDGPLAAEADEDTLDRGQYDYDHWFRIITY
jgi:hypothetical protein